MLLENRELGCQAAQRAARDDSQGLTRTRRCLEPYRATKAALDTPEKGPG